MRGRDTRCTHRSAAPEGLVALTEVPSKLSPGSSTERSTIESTAWIETYGAGCQLSAQRSLCSTGGGIRWPSRRRPTGLPQGSAPRPHSARCHWHRFDDRKFVEKRTSRIAVQWRPWHDVYPELARIDDARPTTGCTSRKHARNETLCDRGSTDADGIAS